VSWYLFTLPGGVRAWVPAVSERAARSNQAWSYPGGPAPVPWPCVASAPIAVDIRDPPDWLLEALQVHE